MKKIKRFLHARLSSGEAGQALILVLMFLAMGSLTLVPTLSHISTALKTGEIYEQNTNELYTADAGIEDSLWRIKYDFMASFPGAEEYNPYDFVSEFPYRTDEINGMMADFTIKNVWFPTNFNLADTDAPEYMEPDEVREMMDSEKLIINGSNDFSDNVSPYTYKIMVDFNPGAGDNLTIKSLGVWLPSGFNYVGPCSLDDGNPFTHPVWEYDNITPDPDAPGGSAVLWSYDPDYPYLTDFPGYNPDDNTFVFTFSYTKENPNWWPAAIAWVTTEMHDQYGGTKPNDVPVSWDIDTRYFKMFSAAGDTSVEAYTSKNELRQMGDAMAGDYVAIGNALLKDDDGDRCRDDWHTPSSFTLDSIPETADAVYAFLYWTGWRNEDAITPVFSDTCSDFDEWVRNAGGAQYQTRVPTGDYDGNGFNSSPYWSKVDETTPNDGDLITGQNNDGGYRLFNFSDFTVPANSEVESLTIYFRAKDAISGTNDLRARIRVDDNNYTGPSQNPGADWTTYSYTWSENPETGDPWTWQEINGDSSNPLERFGVRGSDFNPDIQVSMVYAEVKYYASRWIVSSGDFVGLGTGVADPDPRILTLKNSLNLTSYGTGLFNVSWEQDEGGNLSDNDIFYYAFSGDGGTTWSPYYEAFHGNDPASPFTASIPDDYLTNNFKIRFYFNFHASSKDVYLDNIRITYLPVDTQVTFKINDVQVYLDGSEPAIGLNPLTADRSYAMLNTLSGPHGFSYACVKDVSALIKEYPIDPDEDHHTGNAKYTVDGVSADTRNEGHLSEIAFAGWSLIIVYASPESAGHYIYIRDENFYSHTSGDEDALDFDADGVPGGLITGFKIPDPITDKYGEITETVAAKLTCFIVEGDSWYTSDYIEITGQQSGMSDYLSNSGSPWNNVWNNASYPGNYQGQDIDTFEVYWDDGILTPGDNSLQVDLYSDTDAWNLVYFIISIRSETVTSGTSHYTIRGG